MRPIRTLAAAALACSGLLFALPEASAGAPGETRTGTQADSTGFVLAQAGRDYDRNRSDEQRRWRDGDRDNDRDRHRARDRDRDHVGDRHGDRRRKPDWMRQRDHYRWDYDYHERWRTKHHPRRKYWKGRKLPRHGRYYVIRNYENYHLPRPPRGYYYVRDNDDVFLVLETTRTIVDAFILFELLNR